MPLRPMRDVPPVPPTGKPIFLSAWLAEVRLQPILDRQECIIGFENLARFDGTGKLGIYRMSDDLLHSVTRELLLGLRMRCLLDTHYHRQLNDQRGGQAMVRHFVNVEKRSLAKPAMVDELIESAADLLSTGAQLVVEVTERPLDAPEAFKAYMNGLIRLRQEGVQVALDDYDIHSPIHWELDLGLCDVVKLDLFDLGIACRGDEAFMSDHYARLMERLYQFIHRYPVELVAEKVETDWQYDLVKGLPFKLFQGYRLGRPERV